MSPDRLDGITLIGTNLPGFKTVQAPQDGTNLLRLSDADLRTHFLPHRPDPSQSKAAVKTWRRSLSKVQKFIAPRLTPRPDRRRFPGRFVAPTPSNNSFNWAGSVANEGGFLEVWGVWQVPNVIVPAGPVPNPPIFGAPTFSITIWVGMDGGISTLVNPNASTDVCQAGIEVDIGTDSNGNVTFQDSFAWLFWDNGLNPSTSPTQVNFDFSTGDTIAVQVKFVGPSSADSRLNRAGVTFANLTTGVALNPIIFDAPASVDFIGDTAEWIVERPAFGLNAVGQPILANLPAFGEVIFTDAGAAPGPGSDSKNITILSAAGESQDMLADDNTTILASEVTSPALQVSFQATASKQDQPPFGPLV